ncbi:putative multidrug resistance protein EmrK [Marinomonas spartinae]|uniref:Putative multidrug resistance protein EmrK n=1 Tax=Marinomonas spartinae TaxID=1792290 RepID=A0A1A8T1G5_9GAMM|nr:HlyD family secretion protein [Marinomonas spartinae]SBS25487.1 putative multidrug resistance protein EmrK [Marinomonas spartinae]
MSEQDNNPIETKQSTNRGKRRLLLIGVPLLIVLVSAVIYMLGGRDVETDDAYVQADMTAITNQVSGLIKTVDVKENQDVNKGQLLYSIDARPYQLAVDKAKSQLNLVRNNLLAKKAAYQQELVKLELAKTQLAFNQREEIRQENVFKKHFISDSDYDKAQQAVRVSVLNVAELKNNIKELKADLGGNPDMPVEDQANYKIYQSALDQAELNLSYVKVVAPSNGIVAHLPLVGEYTNTGATRMMLVSDHKRIEANFTEKQLTYVKPGQSVDVSVDTYPGVVWKGKVESISPATGSRFSVLPAQNATGNWVKVAQRLAVRISIQDQPGMPVLRDGMSADVTIDTNHHRSLFGIQL